MSRNKTAAEMILKLAAELEKEAAEKTVFACENCDNKNSLAEINGAIATYAAENPGADTDDTEVTVNDAVSCPNCGHEMSYSPTAESEKFYVTEEDEGKTPEEDEEEEPVKAPAPAPAPVEKEAITVPKIPTEKVVGFLKTLGKGTLQKLDEHIRNMEQEEGPRNPSEESFIKRTPQEEAQIKEMAEKVRKQIEEQRRNLGERTAFSLGNLLPNVTAEGLTNFALALDALLGGSMREVQRAVELAVEEANDAPAPAMSPVAPAARQVADPLKKYASDPKINMAKLSKYLL